MKNKWGVDRFDLEDAMMQVAMTIDDILLVSEMAYEKNWSPDKTMNAWIGLAHLLEARSLKQEEIFVKLLELNQYAPQEQKDNRVWNKYTQEYDDKWEEKDNRPKHWEEKGFDFDEERMDIIGQNGNNGEHYV